MKIAIAAFAKTIGFSPVKTRLARSKGVEFAEGFYRLSVAATREVLLATCDGGKQDVSAYWAVAEKEAANRDTWSDLPVMWTGEGDLGQRLANVYGHLFERHDAVFLMGTDSPQISPDHLNDAFNMLAAGDFSCVAGPAVDGGFYLFGSRVALGSDIWTSVEYSRETTLQELVAVLENHGHETGFLAPMEDVDTQRSLDVLVQSLKSNRQALLPAQLELLAWLEEKHTG